jgi:hypothetical protein
MQIKTKFATITVNEDELSHLSEEEREHYLDEVVKAAVGHYFSDEWFD